MTFLDTGILVGVILQSHSKHAACRDGFKASLRPFTNAHALAETFATLTGFYKVPTDAATELTLGLRDSVPVEPLALADYEAAIREARSRGVMGGGDLRFPSRDICPPEKGSSDRDPQPLAFLSRRAGHRNSDALSVLGWTIWLSATSKRHSTTPAAVCSWAATGSSACPATGHPCARSAARRPTCAGSTPASGSNGWPSITAVRLRGQSRLQSSRPWVKPGFYAPAETAVETIHRRLRAAYEGRDHTFGNARLVRNVFEKSLSLQANRLMRDRTSDRASLGEILASDIPEF